MFILLRTGVFTLSGFSSKHENEYELMSWSLSLVLMYIEGKVDDEIERGFLTGLKNIFIQKRSRYYTRDQTLIKFAGRDLIIHSNEIIKKIDSKLFQQIILNGTSSNILEISAVCNLFRVFTLSGFSSQNKPPL